MKRKKTPNQSPEPTIMAVTPPAAHESRQAASWLIFDVRQNMKNLGIWIILVFEAVFIGFSVWLIYVALRDWSHMNGWVHMEDIFIISPVMIFLPLLLFLLPIQLAYTENQKERKVRIAAFSVWILVASGVIYLVITASSKVTSGC